MNGRWNGHDKAKVIIERGWEGGGVGDVWFWLISFQFPLVPHETQLAPTDPSSVPTENIVTAPQRKNEKSSSPPQP